MTKQFRLENGLLKIGEIAKELSINQSTIRYYTEIGLLPVVETTESGYRLYDREETGRRISIIREINGTRLKLTQIIARLA